MFVFIVYYVYDLHVQIYTMYMTALGFVTTKALTSCSLPVNRGLSWDLYINSEGCSKNSG